MDLSTDNILNGNFLLFMIAIITGIFIFAALYARFFIPFKKERDYIKMEMKRSFKEEEVRYWRKALKYLYLRSIPIIGRFFK